MNPERIPILVLCGSDARRRKLLLERDPEGKYPSKALLPFLGRRVIDWQLEALRECSRVGDLLLLGLTGEMADFSYPVEYLPVRPEATVLEKLLTGMEIFQERYPEHDRLVISTCDTPGMRTESVEDFFDQLEARPEAEAVFSGVPVSALAEDFPDAGRVVGKFSDREIFPGELFALRPEVILQEGELIDGLSRIRRQFNRRGNRVSPGPALAYLARKPRLWAFVLRYLTGTLSLSQAEKLLSKAFGLQVRAVVIDDPGFGMDLDRLEDYQLLERYVRKIKGKGER